MKSGTGFLFLVFITLCFISAKSRCSEGCDLALASFYVWGANLTSIASNFGTNPDEIFSYNKPNVTSKDSVEAFSRIRIPFRCDCISGQFLGHIFEYSFVTGDTYGKIVANYSNLTSVQRLTDFNSYDPNNIPNMNAKVNVTVNCSCGNSQVSKDYGLFVTYPLREEDTLETIAAVENLPPDLLQRYNEGVNFSQGSGEVFIPGRGRSGQYPPLHLSSGLAGVAIAGITVVVVAGVLLLAVCIYVAFYRTKKREGKLLPAASEHRSSHHGLTAENSTDKPACGPGTGHGGAGAGLAGITVDKSVEFSYEELSKATDDFSFANKIGQGGFGTVYYAELRGEKAAIKKMDTQASKEFLAELKVLTHVHHLNLVRLIGYCLEGSLFLVYEFMENGNLSQNLRGSGREPLPWSSRVQIALDSARGLEHIHEHTVPVYIHRDIKSANILIDQNYHGKVADFGLTKLTAVGSLSIRTRVIGTFGYMPPEYVRYGNVSPKLDVYAFGVVLYELISAKKAIVKTDGSSTESIGLVSLFEDVLNQPDPEEDLRMLIDPQLGHNYQLDSVHKMAQLARACTHENPQVRPSMRSIVVALRTLSSNIEDWGKSPKVDHAPCVKPKVDNCDLN